VKLLQDREFRMMGAEKIVLGFDLPGASVGRIGRILEFRKAVWVVESVGGRQGIRTPGLPGLTGTLTPAFPCGPEIWWRHGESNPDLLIANQPSSL
jgi:hypothetical protein